jgi:type I restriction enzyme S subunit
MAEPTFNDVVLKGGELILLWDGSNAGEFFRARAGVLSSTMIAFDFDQREANPDYLYYDLKRFEPELKGRTAGSGIPHVDKDVLLARRIFEGGPDEQKAVAQVLLKVDRSIDQTDAALAKQQRVKTGLMHDLLTRGLDAQGHLRPSAEDARELYWESPVGWIPKNWSVNFLEDCASRITVGLATSVTEYYRTSGTRMIRNMNIRRGYFEAEDMVYLEPDFAARFPNKVVQARDVLTCRTGVNVGDTCLVPAQFAGSHTFTTLITTTNRSKLTPEFLVDYMASEIGVGELGKILVGAGKDNLNARQLALLRVRLPPPIEQKMIHAMIELSKVSLICLSRTLGKLVLLKTALMNDLLTGRVPVTPLFSNPKVAISP